MITTSTPTAAIRAALRELCEATDALGHDAYRVLRSRAPLTMSTILWTDGRELSDAMLIAVVTEDLAAAWSAEWRRASMSALVLPQLSGGSEWLAAIDELLTVADDATRDDA